MANSQALIEASLAAAAAAGDPAADVYRRLFAAHPGIEPLFAADRSGAVRGEMLARTFEVLLDLAGPRSYGAQFIGSELANHDAYGVPRSLFPAFFEIVRDSVAAAAGPAWTAEMAGAWAGLLAEIRAGLPAA